MDPLPASLEAMVRSQPGAPLRRERGPSWVWIVLLIIVLGAAAYYLGLSH